MQNYAPGTAVTVSIDLLAEDGSGLVPNSARWRVLDEADGVARDWEAFSPVPTGITISVTVPSGINTLDVGITSGIRTVEVEVIDDRGTFVLSTSYLLKASTALVFGVNTFLTYGQAMLLAQEFVGRFIQTWLTEPSRDEQEAALVQAYSRVTKQPLNLEFSNDQSRIVDYPWGTTQFEDLSPENIADFDPRLLKALKRAQLIEAAYVLSEDGVNAARNQGLMSQTVGESSQFFRPSKPLDMGICKEAAAELARWTRRSVRLGRA